MTAILNQMCILNFVLFDISMLTQKYFWKGWKCVPGTCSLNLLGVSGFLTPLYSRSILSFNDGSNPISEKVGLF